MNLNLSRQGGDPVAEGAVGGVGLHFQRLLAVGFERMGRERGQRQAHDDREGDAAS